MLDKSIVDKLLSNTPFALIISGLLFFVLGAAGGWSSLSLQIDELGWRIAIAVIGILVGGIGLLFIWSEKIGRNPSNSHDYGLKILFPASGKGVDKEFEVYGTFEKLPPKNSVKLFVQSPRTGEYWPETESVKLDKDENRWHGRVYIGGNPGRQRKIIVATMNGAGQALCNYYEKAGKKTNQWVGINSLSPDIRVYDSVSVFRRNPQVSNSEEIEINSDSS